MKQAASLSASIALCALIPLNFLTAHGHTLPETETANDLLRSNLDDSRPDITLPVLNKDHKSSSTQTASLSAPVLPVMTDSADLADERFSAANGKQYKLSVLSDRHTGYASVAVNGLEVVKFRSDVLDNSGEWQNPAQRAQATQTALKQFLTANGQLSEIVPVELNNRVYLTAKELVIAEVDITTARLVRSTPLQLASIWSGRMKQAISGQFAHKKAPVKPLATAHAVVKQQPEIEAPKTFVLKGRRLASGLASWYGPGFHGRRAANGSIFNQYAMTAAHKTLPFGTLVRVTNRQNGRQCVVKITDRGPFCGNRVIDLSRKAAETIGMMGSGVASVQLEAVASNT